MKKSSYRRSLIIRGLVSIEPTAPSGERASYLEAAAELLEESDDELSGRCAATAACLREADTAQLQLFESIRPSNQPGSH